MTSTHFNPVDIDVHGGYIQGLTHPSNVMQAVAPLWKRRAGTLSAAVKTSWVERLFVLTDTALFWYELGGMLVSQHGRVEFRHIRSIRSVEQSSGAAANASEPDLANHGPMHQLEITLVTDFVLLVGGSQPEFVEAWKLAIAQSVERAALLLANPSEPPPPLPSPPAALRRLELTGIVAIGVLGKARSALTGTLKTGLEHAGFISHHDLAAKQRDGWSSRNVVLTENALYFYKPILRKHADTAEPSVSGDYIFGREVGRMPLGMADVHVEQVVDDSVQYFQICVTGGVGSLAPGSFLTRGIASFARVSERGSDRFKALLRTSDAKLAAEWIAVLRTACGRQRSQGFERLQTAIAAGDVQVAMQMAEDLASLSAAVPGRQAAARSHSLREVSARSNSPRTVGQPDSPTADGSSGSPHLGGSPPSHPTISGLPWGSGGASRMSRNSGESPCAFSVGSSAARPFPSLTPHVRHNHSMSSDDAMSESEANVQEPSVVLHPVGKSSEMRQLTDELMRARQQLGVQKAALHQARAALACWQGSAPPSVSAAAAAVAAALQPSETVDSPAWVPAEDGSVIARAEMSSSQSPMPPAALPGSTLEAAQAAVAKAAAQASAEARAQHRAIEVEVVPVQPETRHTHPVTAASSSTSLPAAVGFSAAASAAASAAKSAEDEEAEEARRTGRPRAGFSTASFPSLVLSNGNGTEFDLRTVGYLSHKKKAMSAFHVWEPVRVDVFKRRSAAFHVASKLTLPPPPEGSYSAPNTSGLPRRFIINTIIPAEAPSLLGGYDGLCYQLVIVFAASSERLQKWVDEGSGAVKLFQRFFADAPEGVLPTSGDTDVKEQLKLLPKVDNMKSLGLSVVEKYNGKPALLTKSGSIHRGDDYIEIGMNTFRFGYMTKKGVNTIFHKIKDMDFHAALTIEGRKDEELPEQVLCAVRLKNLDLTSIAHEIDETLGE